MRPKVLLWSAVLESSVGDQSIYTVVFVSIDSVTGMWDRQFNTGSVRHSRDVLLCWDTTRWFTITL